MNYYAGYHSYFAGAPGNMSFLTTKDYDNYLVSLADFPRYNQQHIDDLTIAIEKGYTQYCETFKDYHKSISKHIVDKVEDSNFWAPLANIPANFNAQDKQAYRKKAKQLIADVTVFDIFKGESVEAGKISIGITVKFQPKEATLTEEEIESICKKIISNVSKQTGGILRG